jgi:O-antigen/teichoic acid export membrane protein
VSESQSSYRQIFKATSLFGGVQVINILTGMVRVKFVAVLLGTAGVGLMGLLNSPLQLIISISGLGIAFSAVRDISEAHGSGDQSRIARAIITLNRWSWFAGLLGAIATAALAPMLSRWTFGNNNYTWAFLWLSVTILLQVVRSGQITILQGTRRLREMAKASVLGSLIGLITAVPLYYFFGINGIVPSLIITALTSLLLSWHFIQKVRTEPVKLSYRETFYQGKTMVKLGIIMTITVIMTTLSSYVTSAFIGRTGGVDQVGLYNAGWSIILQSTDLVFTAMATDYFPRLSALNIDNSRMSRLVNQQTEMAVIILAPLCILLIAIMPIVIKLLYTTAFLSVVIFANWMLMGILLKGLVWSVGYIFPANGDFKAFGIIEVITITFNLITNIIGYKYWGLQGLGVSFILDYIFGLILSLWFAHKKYGFKYEKSTLVQFFLNLLLVSGVFSISYFINQPSRYYFLFPVFVISVLYSLYILNKRVGLKTFFADMADNLKKK